MNDIRELSSCEFLACVFSVGGLSLLDEQVARTLASLQEVFKDHPLIVLSDLSESLEIATAIEIGLRGFLPTTMPTHIAFAAIQFILAGGTYLPHSVNASLRYTPAADEPVTHVGTRRLLRPVRQSAILQKAQGSEPGTAGYSDAPRLAVSDAAAETFLKQRHVEVLAGVCEGHTNKVIARQLNLTEATVKLYVRQLMKIFDAENRTQLALKGSGHPQFEDLAQLNMNVRAGSAR